jgi:hypothetical protein
MLLPARGRIVLPTEGRQLGCDWLFPDGDDVIVVAKRAMPKWEATQFRKTAVVLDGRRWSVAGYEPPAGRVNPARGIGHRYRLTPWPDDLHDFPANTFDYDALHVTQREQVHRATVRLFGKWLLLAPFYPLLGLLPSRAKVALARSYGVRAQTSTRQSLRVEYIIGFICAGILVPQIILDDPLGVGVLLPAIVGLCTLTDFLMRWDRSALDHPLQYGAFEWVFHRLDPRPAPCAKPSATKTNSRSPTRRTT